MIQAILVDDEKRAVDNLKSLLNRHCSEVTVCGTANSIEEAEPLIREIVPDVIFLDIEMPGGNGFDLLERIRDLKVNVIFVTAFDSFAIQAFQANAVNYILKPIDSKLLKSSVEHLKKFIGVDNTNLKVALTSLDNVRKVARIKVPTMNGFEFLPIADILYIQSNGSYSQVILKGSKKVVLSKNIGKVEDDLGSDSFFRVHREYLVNVKEIHRYIKGKGGQIILKNGQALPVAVRRKNKLMEILFKRK